MKSLLLILALMASFVVTAAGEWSTSGSMGAELRWFFDDAQFPGQLNIGSNSTMRLKASRRCLILLATSLILVYGL